VTLQRNAVMSEEFYNTVCDEELLELNESSLSIIKNCDDLSPQPWSHYKVLDVVARSVNPTNHWRSVSRRLHEKSEDTKVLTT